MIDREGVSERALAFSCAGETLVGVISCGAEQLPLGVVIIVGGPQYRVGSHRQFVSLARRLASAGFPTLRFDYRGMGDSSGGRHSFEFVEDDIRAAIDALMAAHADLQAVVLWGLCDAASAAMLYAATDHRVAGLLLANPWARGDDSFARTQLRHYYLRRLFSPDLWKKVLRGGFLARKSASDLALSFAKATRGGDQTHGYRDRMMRNLERFKGRCLLVISGQDLTAREFLVFASSWSSRSTAPQPALERLDLPEADHTFSRREWKHQVEDMTLRWLRDVLGDVTHTVRGDSNRSGWPLDHSPSAHRAADG